MTTPARHEHTRMSSPYMTLLSHSAPLPAVLAPAPSGCSLSSFFQVRRRVPIPTQRCQDHLRLCAAPLQLEEHCLAPGSLVRVRRSRSLGPSSEQPFYVVVELRGTCLRRYLALFSAHGRFSKQ